jgi:Zn-dependent alcohol dehydrogenase
MKTRAAVPRKAGIPGEMTELELDPPRANEVPIRMEAAGLCHCDEHIRAKYSLDEINEGYADLMEDRNIRGFVVHQH